jgi:hypothetical protein
VGGVVEGAFEGEAEGLREGVKATPWDWLKAKQKDWLRGRLILEPGMDTGSIVAHETQRKNGKQCVNMLIYQLSR